MDEKFASVTAQLVVRKGEAAPSTHVVAAGSGTRKTKEHLTASNVVAMNGFAAPDGIFKTAVQKPSPKQRRVMVMLSEREHETLGHIAAKNGLTRYQIVRKALDSYFEWLIDEYANSCRCISTTCSDSCDHLSAAELAEQPVGDRQTD